jgi:hypothetical protein
MHRHILIPFHIFDEFNLFFQNDLAEERKQMNEVHVTSLQNLLSFFFVFSHIGVKGLGNSDPTNTLWIETGFDEQITE